MNFIIKKYDIELDKIETVIYPYLEILSNQENDNGTFVMYAIHHETEKDIMKLLIYKSGDSIDWQDDHITSIGDLHFFKTWVL